MVLRCGLVLLGCARVFRRMARVVRPATTAKLITVKFVTGFFAQRELTIDHRLLVCEPRRFYLALQSVVALFDRFHVTPRPGGS